MAVKPFDQIAREPGLVQMASRLSVVVAPGEMRAQEPLNNTHELNLDEIRQDLLKLLLHSIARREIDKVVNVEPQRDRLVRGNVTLVVWVLDIAQVHTRVVGIPSEPH